jgi:hypothetical protein
VVSVSFPHSRVVHEQFGIKEAGMAETSAKSRVQRVIEKLAEGVAMGFITLMTLVSTLRLLGLVS